MKESQKVSILSANFNNAKFLDDYFDSIAKQTYCNIEVVFVDDGSTDNSNAVVKSYQSHFKFPINHIELTHNIGFANALNQGLEYCDGEFVVRIDPDDTMSPDRIEKQVEFLLSNLEYSVVGSNASYFQVSPSKPISSSNFRSDFNWIKNKYFQAEYGVMHGTLMLRKSVFDNVKYYQDEVPAEDYALLSRIIKLGYKVNNIEDTLTQVRIHSNSVSNSLPLMTITKLFILRRDILNVNYSFCSVLLKFFHFRFYRNYLKSSNIFVKYIYLLCAVFFAPTKSCGVFFSKIIGNIKSR